MPVKKSGLGKGLGKGLDSLIPDKVGVTETIEEEKKEELMVNINKVEPNKEQPRKNFDEDALLELSESIKQFGVLQPLIVQDRDTYYEIIAGERRWRAAKLAGVKEIPVIVKKLTPQEMVEISLIENIQREDFNPIEEAIAYKRLTPQEIVEISLIENIQREDLNPIEEAIAYKRLLTEFHLKQDEVAERVSKSRTTVTNSMRLLKLNVKVQQMIIDEMLTTGHARALLALEDEEVQFMAAQKIFDEKLSVRETEKLVKKILKGEPDSPEKQKEDDEELKRLKVVYHDIEEKMKQVLGTKVIINYKDKNKGKIEIEYYDAEQFEHLFEMLQSLKK